MKEYRFKDVAMTEHNPDWERCINREKAIYSRDDDVRSPFARDYTRVLHSLAYRRLKHKTQVFLNAAGNDHICTRMEHVQHVESVSHTIACDLGLNEELTRAIAIAHDLGHAPFGHDGEKIIRELTKENLKKDFWHEQNGVYFVDNIELLEDNQKKLRNLNLTYAVRDGIISHCGEVDQNAIKPRVNIWNLNDFDTAGKYQAATWEGCVVKLADKIADLGRDIEDGIRRGYLSEKDMEVLQEMAKRINKDAINTTVITHNMIIDLCKNSSVESGLRLSGEMSELMDEIKKFDLEKICLNKKNEPSKKYAKLILDELFNALVDYYDEHGQQVLEYLDRVDFEERDFVKNFARWIVQYCDMDFNNLGWARRIAEGCDNKKIYGDLSSRDEYVQAVIDFLAGMTDAYAIKSFEELLR